MLSSNSPLEFTLILAGWITASATLILTTTWTIELFSPKSNLNAQPSHTIAFLVSISFTFTTLTVITSHQFPFLTELCPYIGPIAVSTKIIATHLVNYFQIFRWQMVTKQVFSFALAKFLLKASKILTCTTVLGLIVMSYFGTTSQMSSRPSSCRIIFVSRWLIGISFAVNIAVTFLAVGWFRFNVMLSLRRVEKSIQKSHVDATRTAINFHIKSAALSVVSSSILTALLMYDNTNSLFFIAWNIDSFVSCFCVWILFTFHREFFYLCSDGYHSCIERVCGSGTKEDPSAFRETIRVEVRSPTAPLDGNEDGGTHPSRPVMRVMSNSDPIVAPSPSKESTSGVLQAIVDGIPAVLTPKRLRNDGSYSKMKRKMGRFGSDSLLHGDENNEEEGVFHDVASPSRSNTMSVVEMTPPPPATTQISPMIVLQDMDSHRRKGVTNDMASLPDGRRISLREIPPLDIPSLPKKGGGTSNLLELPTKLPSVPKNNRGGAGGSSVSMHLQPRGSNSFEPSYVSESWSIQPPTRRPTHRQRMFRHPTSKDALSDMKDSLTDASELVLQLDQFNASMSILNFEKSFGATHRLNRQNAMHGGRDLQSDDELRNLASFLQQFESEQAAAVRHERSQHHVIDFEDNNSRRELTPSLNGITRILDMVMPSSRMTPTPLSTRDDDENTVRDHQNVFPTRVVTV